MINSETKVRGLPVLLESPTHALHSYKQIFPAGADEHTFRMTLTLADLLNL